MAVIKQANGRMRRKWNPHTTGGNGRRSNHLENTWTVSGRLNIVAMGPINSTRGSVPPQNENMRLHRHLCGALHSSITRNVQKAETKRPPSDNWTSKKHNSATQEQINHPARKRNDVLRESKHGWTLEPLARGQKPGTRGHILYDPTYINVPQRHIHPTERRWVAAEGWRAGGKEPGEWLLMGWLTYSKLRLWWWRHNSVNILTSFNFTFKVGEFYGVWIISQ